ncbi:hypothetical protein [Hyphomicrobium sp. DY-1]|uniref:hypothetical protein n=1 Tax=Hyphomicrobium sp. DY-1 TaxID=3075650 RepID=UPI0039C42C12
MTREVSLKPGWLREDTRRAAQTMRERRNLDPHAEAIIAMNLWGDHYSKQRLGCMDWYDSLSPASKARCTALVDRILLAHRETKEVD